MNKDELIAFIRNADENTKGDFLIKSTSDISVFHMTDGYYRLGLTENGIKKCNELAFVSNNVDLGLEHTISEFENGKITIEYFPGEE